MVEDINTDCRKRREISAISKAIRHAQGHGQAMAFPILTPLQGCVSPFAFELILAQAGQALHYDMEACAEEGHFRLQRKAATPGVPLHVVYEDTGLTSSFSFPEDHGFVSVLSEKDAHTLIISDREVSCTCQYMNAWRLPCRHYLCQVILGQASHVRMDVIGKKWLSMEAPERERQAKALRAVVPAKSSSCYPQFDDWAEAEADGGSDNDAGSGWGDPTPQQKRPEWANLKQDDRSALLSLEYRRVADLAVMGEEEYKWALQGFKTMVAELSRGASFDPSRPLVLQPKPVNAPATGTDLPFIVSDGFKKAIGMRWTVCWTAYNGEEFDVPGDLTGEHFISHYSRKGSDVWYTARIQAPVGDNGDTFSILWEDGTTGVLTLDGSKHLMEVALSTNGKVNTKDTVQGSWLWVVERNLCDANTPEDVDNPESKRTPGRARQKRFKPAFGPTS